jgi:hypothetical protein
MTNFWFDVDALRRAYMQARTDLAFLEGFASTAKIMTDGEISERFEMIQERARKSLDAIAPPPEDRPVMEPHEHSGYEIGSGGPL